MKKKLFDMIPTIESERLIIKKIAPEDKYLLKKFAQDAELYKYLPTYLL